MPGKKPTHHDGRTDGRKNISITKEAAAAAATILPPSIQFENVDFQTTHQKEMQDTFIFNSIGKIQLRVRILYPVATTFWV